MIGGGELKVERQPFKLHNMNKTGKPVALPETKQLIFFLHKHKKH